MKRDRCFLKNNNWSIRKSGKLWYKPDWLSTTDNWPKKPAECSSTKSILRAHTGKTDLESSTLKTPKWSTNASNGLESRSPWAKKTTGSTWNKCWSTCAMISSSMTHFYRKRMKKRIKLIKLQEQRFTRRTLFSRGSTQMRRTSSLSRSLVIRKRLSLDFKPINWKPLQPCRCWRSRRVAPRPEQTHYWWMKAYKRVKSKRTFICPRNSIKWLLMRGNRSSSSLCSKSSRIHLER